jgi:hypothetical protein
MSQDLLLAVNTRESVSVGSNPLSVIAQYSQPLSGTQTVESSTRVAPQRGTKGLDDQGLGAQLRDAIRAGQDPWVAAGRLLMGRDANALAKSSDPLLQFFGRYMKAATQAKLAWPSSHREAIGNLKSVLKAIGKTDTESFLRSAATLGLNLGFKPLADAANKANADPVLVAAFVRSFGAKPGAAQPKPTSPPKVVDLGRLGESQGRQGVRSLDGSIAGSSSGSPRPSADSSPLTTASADELTARWLAGESWYDIAAGLIADRAPGSVTPAQIETLPTSPGLKEAVYALIVMRDQGYTLDKLNDASGDGARYVMKLPSATAQGAERAADLGLVTSWTSLLAGLGVEPLAFQKSLGDSAGNVAETYNRLQAESEQTDQLRLSPKS